MAFDPAGRHGLLCLTTTSYYIRWYWHEKHAFLFPSELSKRLTHNDMKTHDSRVEKWSTNGQMVGFPHLCCIIRRRISLGGPSPKTWCFVSNNEETPTWWFWWNEVWNKAKKLDTIWWKPCWVPTKVSHWRSFSQRTTRPTGQVQEGWSFRRHSKIGREWEHHLEIKVNFCKYGSFSYLDIFVHNYLCMREYVDILALFVHVEWHLRLAWTSTTAGKSQPVGLGPMVSKRFKYAMNSHE